MGKRRSASTIIRKAVRAMFYLLIFSVNVFILWRVIASGDPREMETLMVNEHTAAAYEQKGEEMTLFYQVQDDITRAEHNYGYFSITDAVFIPEAHQIQIVFRYNNSTIRSLAEDYDLPAVPDREEELYDVTLYIHTDLTPDVADDNLGNDPASVSGMRYYPSAVIETTKNMYNYRKYIFDGIDIDPLTLAVFADIYYIEDVHYDEAPYGTLCLYDFKTVNHPRKLTRRDVAALKAWSTGGE